MKRVSGFIALPFDGIPVAISGPTMTHKDPHAESLTLHPKRHFNTNAKAFVLSTLVLVTVLLMGIGSMSII